MEDVKFGDIDKLGLLYTKYKKVLFAYFYRMTYKSATSEDLVQNVFYRILKYRNKFRNEGKFSTWMFSIAHNVFADHLRKQKRVEYAADLSKWDIPEPNLLDEQLEQNEKRELLQKAMKQLSDEQRETLILSRFHELKYREIAIIFNCTESTIKVRIFRAVNNLKKICAKMEN